MDTKAFADLFQGATIVDLSHTLQPGIPVWPTHAHFVLQQWEDRAKGDGSNHFFVGFGEHNGTHIDSSYHFCGPERGKTIDEYPLDIFFGPCVTMHFHDKQAGETIEKADVLAWEASHGPIDAGSVILVDFGWSKRFKPLPEGKPFLEGWPGVGKSAAEYFFEKKAAMVGVDPCAVDASGAVGDPAHNALLPNETLVIECLANLDQLPDRAFFICLPLRIKGGSGSPIRAVALY